MAQVVLSAPLTAATMVGTVVLVGLALCGALLVASSAQLPRLLTLVSARLEVGLLRAASQASPAETQDSVCHFATSFRGRVSHDNSQNEADESARHTSQ